MDKAVVLISLVAVVTHAGNQGWSDNHGDAGGGHIKEGLLLKPVTEEVGPATLTTIKKFIAHVDTSVVPIKFEHIRVPNAFGGHGGGGQGGGGGFGGGEKFKVVEVEGGSGGWNLGGGQQGWNAGGGWQSGGNSGWSGNNLGSGGWKIGGGNSGGWMASGNSGGWSGNSGGWSSGGNGGGWSAGGNAGGWSAGGNGGGWSAGGNNGGWSSGGGGWMSGGNAGGWSSGGLGGGSGFGGGHGLIPMLMDVPVQIHKDQFKNQPQLKKVFKAIPVQVKAVEQAQHGGGSGWH